MCAEINRSQLQEIEPNVLWTCATNLRFLWIPIGARMTIIKFPTNELFIHSPIGLSDKIRRELSHLGKIRYVVSPNCLHHLFLTDYVENCQTALFFASPGLVEKRMDLSFNRQLKDQPEPEWSPYLDQLIIAGAPSLREVVFFHRQTRTLIVADLIMNFTDNADGFLKTLLKIFRMFGRPFSTIDSSKLSATEKSLVKYSLERILQWDFDRIILSHGDIIPFNGKEVFEDVFSSVLI